MHIYIRVFLILLFRVLLALLINIIHQIGPDLDIVIDDGGHSMNQQITSFHTLFPLLKNKGLYVIEDLHTSYWRGYGGRKGKKHSTIGLIKHLIDEIHYWCYESLFTRIKYLMRRILGLSGGTAQFRFNPKNIYEESIHSITIADSICFIKKEALPKYEIVKI